MNLCFQDSNQEHFISTSFNLKLHFQNIALTFQKNQIHLGGGSWSELKKISMNHDEFKTKINLSFNYFMFSTIDFWNIQVRTNRWIKSERCARIESDQNWIMVENNPVAMCNKKIWIQMQLNWVQWNFIKNKNV